ncbi:MAG: histidine phosphatase family protein [Halieaceae bacterium]|jgi:broad specificity phosphatase PhoE|nr:histidine phosphatase family protein [Halieaceae bacterium]
MASIYLIRHGQASFGEANYDRLSPLGCRQAEALGEYFERRDIRFDAVYTGGLERQRKTAELALGKWHPAHTHRVDERFNEIDNEGQLKAITPVLLEQNPELQAWADAARSSSKDYQKLLERVFNHWVESGDNPMAGLQSWPAYRDGVRAALTQVTQEQGPGTRAAIFTSGGTIATIVAEVLGVPGNGVYQFYEPVINCSVTELLYNPRKMSVSYFNDHSFLDLIGRQSGEALISYR